jgi:hypothetical protein
MVRLHRPESAGAASASVRRLLLPSILTMLAFAAPAVAAPPAYTSYTSPTLRQFGEDEAFLAYLVEARAAAHARGRWWTDDPPVSPASLEVLPGSHGEYDFEELNLPSGGSLYYSQVDLTRIRPGAEIVWPGLRKRGKVLAGDSFGPPHEDYDQARRNPLWSPGEIYRPARDTLEPNIHSLTICTRRAVLGAHPSGCRTTAFIAPRGGELIVTATHAFVWSVPEYGDMEALKAAPDCRLRAGALEAEGLPSLVYRLPLAGGPLEVLGTRGSPAWGADYHVDDADNSSGRLRAFVAWPRVQCAGDPRLELDAPTAQLTLLDAPLSLFGRRLDEVPERFETRLPPAASGAILSRFVGEWLLYGELSYEFAVPYQDRPPRTGRLRAAPLARPTQVRTLELAHDIVAIVPAGGRALITGYRDSTGLALSIVELGAEPRIVSTLDLPGLRQRGAIRGFIRAIPAPDGSVAIELPVDKVDAPHESGPAGFRAVSIITLRIDPSGRLSAPRTTLTPARLPSPITTTSWH